MNNSHKNRIVSAVLGLALFLSPALAAAETDLCRSATAKGKIRDVEREAKEVLRLVLRPDSRPEDWAGVWAELLSDQTMLVGLCSEPKVLDLHCPLCSVGENVPVRVETAPALLLRWILGNPKLFDPRDRV